MKSKNKPKPSGQILSAKEINALIDGASDKKLSYSCLVVDDDPSMRKALGGILEQEFGFKKVEQAKDGLEALRLLKKKKFDLVLVDWMMPRMDGYNFVKIVRKTPCIFDVKIIMVTSKRDIEDITKAAKAGVTDYIVKPFDHAIVTKKVSKILHSSGASGNEKKHLEEGRTSLKIKEYDEALGSFHKAQEIVPGRIDTKVEIAETLLEKGDVSLADAILEEALQNNTPEYLIGKASSTHARLGDAYYKDEKFQKAEQKYYSSLKLDPMQDKAYTGLGKVEEQKGNLDTAKQHFEKAKSLNTAEGKIERAKKYIEYGDIEQADNALSDLLNTKLSDTVSKAASYLITGIGYHYLEQEKVPEAETKFNEAITVDSKQREAFVGLGEVELKRNNKNAAMKFFDKAGTLDVEEGDMIMFNHMAIRHRKMGRPKEAAKVLERALIHFPDDAILHYNLGRAYMDTGNKKKAIANFKASLKLDPELVEAEEMLDALTGKAN